MNNKTENILCILLLALIGIVIGGCDEFKSEEDFFTTRATPEELYEIEGLDLNKVEIKKDDSTETTEPPEKMELTLEQCRAIALEHNLDLKAQLISPAISRENQNAEAAKFEWTFTGRVQKTKSDTPTSTTLEGSQVDALSTNLGVNMPLRTGGTLSFNAADNIYETNNAFSTLNPSYSDDMSLSISQPLLQGAGKRTSTHSIRIADYDTQIMDARTKLEIIRVLAAADRVYWRLYAARRELELRKKEYELANAQLERSKRFVEAGERAQIEVLRAEAGVAQRLSAIIASENALRERQRELKQTLNKPELDIASVTTLIPATIPDPVNYQFDQDRLMTSAVENRMEMLELELYLARDASSIDYMRNLALPVATVDYTYNVNGLGPSTKDSLDLLWDKRFEDHRFGLQVAIPLGNEAAKSRLRSARLQRMQRLASKDGRQKMIELEVLNAIDNVDAAWQQILASRQSAVLEGRLYEAEQRQFEIGLSTNTDVLEAQANFANAQSSEILALTQYQIALVDIAFATGTLLGSAKIEWEPSTPLEQ